jgi:hypothetical protein
MFKIKNILLLVTLITIAGCSNPAQSSATPVQATSINLSINVNSMYTGDTHSLFVQLVPSNAVNVISVSSSNSTVRVNQLANGSFSLTALTTGSSVITASTDNGISNTLSMTVKSTETKFIDHLKEKGTYISSSNTYIANTALDNDDGTVISTSFAYDADDREFYFSALGITEDGSTELTIFSIFSFKWGSLARGEGGNLITFETSLSTYNALYDLTSISFRSASEMTIGRYSRTYTNFPASLSLVDLVELSADLLILSYENLYQYCIDNNLGTSYYA